MAKPITVTAEMLNLDEHRAQLNRLAAAPQRRIIKRALAKAGEMVRFWATENIRRLDLVDTGALLNSIQVTVKAAEVWIFSNMVYAAIHEFGGTIFPTKAKKLAIPVSDAADAAGSPRDFPGDLHVEGNFIEGGILADADGNTHYVLVDSVTIPAKPYMAPAVEDHMDEIQQIFIDEIEAGIAEELGGGE